MSGLMIYEKGQHKAGFIGAAIRTKVKGEDVQLYFSFKEYGREKAIELAAQCSMDIDELHRLKNEAINLSLSEKIYKGKALFCRVKNVSFGLDRGRHPFIVYQNITSNITTKKSTFYTELDCDYAFYTACRFKAIQEYGKNVIELTEHWVSARPSWAEVQAYYKKRYQFIDWK